MFVQKPFNERMWQHPCAPRGSLKVRFVFVSPNWRCEIFQNAKRTTWAEIGDGPSEMIFDVLHHRRRNQSRGIENRCKSLILSVLPQAHLASDIAEQMGVMWNQSQAAPTVDIAELWQRFIKPSFERSMAWLRPISHVAREEILRESSAPAKCDGFFTIIWRWNAG